MKQVTKDIGKMIWGLKIVVIEMLGEEHAGGEDVTKCRPPIDSLNRPTFQFYYIQYVCRGLKDKSLLFFGSIFPVFMNHAYFSLSIK